MTELDLAVEIEQSYLWIVIVGGLFGFLLGAGWFSIFNSANLQQLLYFSEVVSNNVTCSKPSEQNFVCSVYKDGKVIQTL